MADVLSGRLPRHQPLVADRRDTPLLILAVWPWARSLLLSATVAVITRSLLLSATVAVITRCVASHERGRPAVVAVEDVVAAGRATRLPAGRRGRGRRAAIRRSRLARPRMAPEASRRSRFPGLLRRLLW